MKLWCEFFGVEVKRGHAIVYKAVRDSFSSARGFHYPIGKKVEAPDWDGGKVECGGGLHFSPRAFMALEFDSDAKRFLACRVALEDMRKPHAGDTYPHKIKARCCDVLYECDQDGEEIKL